MSESKKIAFDVSITFIASISNVIIGFIVIILLGRYVGANDLGLYRMVATLFSLILLIAMIGIPSATIKYIAEYKADQTQKNQILSAGIITVFIIGIFFSIGSYLLAEGLETLFGMPQLSDLIFILGPVFPFALVGETTLGFLNGLREMKKFTAIAVAKSVLMLIITTTLILNGLGAIGAVLGLTLSSIGSCILSIILANPYFNFTLKEYYSTTKTLLRFGVQVALTQAISETTNQLDIILIGFYLMSIDLGYYAVSTSISKFLWLIPLSIQKITYPITSEHWKKSNHQSLHKILDKSMKYSTILLVLLGLGTFFLSKDVIFFLFNEEYIYSVLPLQILLISTVIRGSITQPIGGSLAGIGRPDLLLKTILIVTFSNFFFGVLLIPQYGIVGAAISTSISLIIGSIINLILVIKYLSFRFDLQWFIRMLCIVFLAIIIFQFGILFFNQFIITGIIMLCCVLLIYVFLLAPDDIRFFKSLIYSALKQKNK